MIGLGRMGANMVRRLMRGNHKCIVFDLNLYRGDTVHPNGYEYITQFSKGLFPE